MQILAVPNKKVQYQREDADTLRTELKSRRLLSKNSPLSHFLELLMEVSTLRALVLSRQILGLSEKQVHL